MQRFAMAMEGVRNAVNPDAILEGEYSSKYLSCGAHIDWHARIRLEGLARGRFSR